jgi:hypothetical protein
MASTFLSLAYALREQAHVKVDFITNYLSGPTLILLEIFTSLLAVFFCLIMGWEGLKMATVALRNWEVSPSLLRTPVFIPQLFIPIGSLLLTLEFIRLLKNLFRELPATRKPGKGSILLQFWITALFAAGLAINIGTGNRHTLNQTLALLEKITGRPTAAKYAPLREGDIRDSQADISRAKDVLGYEPHVGLEEGLKRTWEWFQTNQNAPSHA